MTQDELKLLVIYDPLTGVFVSRLSGKTLGFEYGGYAGNRYVGIRLGGRNYYAHRLARLYMTGEWPKNTVDHRDRVRKNNVWSNLRGATRAQQQHNTPARTQSLTGLKGVCVHKSSGLYGARICENGRQRSLGYFRTAAEAHAAYVAAARLSFGTYAINRGAK